MINERGLMDLKEDIDEAKEQVAKLKGQREHLAAELKEKWDCATPAEAQKKIATMNAEIEELENKIDTALAEIEEGMGT